MRALLFSSLIVALLSSASAFAGDQAIPEPVNPSYTPGNIEPVLVHVNAQGRVTDALPAYRLSPDLMRLLRSNLDEMIHKPAFDKQGKPMATQFIINLTLQSAPRSGGGYDAHFAYVSASPVPEGRWYWTHDATGRLGLASSDALGSDTHQLVDNTSSFMFTPPGLSRGRTH